MKGGKDEEKVMGPLFPRLHVNHTEKGGPRAPPRNKMALYEQLSVPSQRFSSGSVSLLPLPPNNGNGLVPSTSSSRGGGQERSVFTPFCNSPKPALLPEKIYSYSFSGVKLNTSVENHDRKSIKPTNFQTLNPTGQLSSTMTCNLLQPHNISNSQNSSVKKFGEENDFGVPTFGQTELTPRFSKSLHNIDREKLPHWGPNPSKQLQTAPEKQMKETGTTDLRSGLLRNQNGGNINVSQSSEDPVQKPASIPLTEDKILTDASSSPSARDKISESLKRAHPLSNQENKRSSLDDVSRLHVVNGQFHQECLSILGNEAFRDGALVEPAKGIGMANASKVRSESCSRASLGNDHRDPIGLENGRECHEAKGCRSLQMVDANRNDDCSETSMVDSISGLDISPDDVVGVIGEKQFWKARKAIVNQQRVFAVQVFELHRLIKVQRLIAGSPNLLLENNLYLSKPSLKVSPVKKLPSDYVLELPLQIVKLKDDSQKPNSGTECAAENAVAKLPLPSVNNDTNKAFVASRSNCGPYSVNPPLASIAADSKLTPWCYHPPPGNQWLVPVMSPSEGLVYKPYTGPCPPTAGFMAPIYGSCGPMNLNPGGGDFLSAAYGVPASHQQGIGILPGTTPLGQTYFPSYGLPTMGPSISSSAVKQMSPFTGAQSNGQGNQLSVSDVFTVPYQSSCNMSSQKNGVISCGIGKFQPSKDSELQGSTASSPSEMAQGDALPLFPMAPTIEISNQPVQTHSTDHRTQVIKVVPHNPRSASESAAWIFRSIQEERKQYD